ncbi:hypothetical protein [Mycobacterium sp.]
MLAGNIADTCVAVRHQPSAAAHVFTAHALAAGGMYVVHAPTRAFTR